VIWSIAECDAILGDAGQDIIMSYMQSVVNSVAPQLSDRINAYTHTKDQRQKFQTLQEELRRIHDSMKPMIRAKRASLQQQINTVIPAYIDPPSLKRRAEDDDDFSCLGTISDHLHQALQMYNTKLPEMCYGFYEMWQQGLTQIDTYGKTVSKLYLEYDVLLLVLESVAIYLASVPTDVQAFRNVCKAVSMTRLLPEKNVLRVNWSALTECLHRINSTWFPNHKFDIFPHTTMRSMGTCSCGLSRPMQQWISQCTSQCPSCRTIPGVVFYFLKVGCDVAESFRYAMHAAQLHIPQKYPEIETAVMEIKRSHKEINDIAKDMDRQMNDHEKEMQRIRMNIETLRHEYYKTTEHDTIPSHMTRPFFDVIRCDVETCYGLVDLDEGRCSQCNRVHCPECWKHIGDTHTCTEQALENVSMIKRTAKQCPMCRCVIQKSEGCPIMFCTQCRTGFDYDTGKQITGLIDNPHYYDMLFSEDTPTVYPTDGLPSFTLVHQFNEFSVSDASDYPDPQLVEKVLARSIRSLLDTTSVDSYVARYMLLNILGFEQTLKYICGDDTLENLVQTYRLLHRLELFAQGMDSIVREFMQPQQTRQVMLRLVDESAAICKRIDPQMVQQSYHHRITELGEL